MEFEIDGKMFINKFWGNKHRGFLHSYAGLLGRISRAYDELMLRYLLKLDISKSDVVNAHDRYEIKTSPFRIDLLTRQFNRDVLVIYCSSAHLYSTQFKLNIEKTEQSYIWYFGPGHKYTFQKEAYEMELNAYKNKLEENNFTASEAINLYKYKW